MSRHRQPDYDAARKRRSTLTARFSDEAIAAWVHQPLKGEVSLRKGEVDAGSRERIASDDVPLGPPDQKSAALVRVMAVGRSG